MGSAKSCRRGGFRGKHKPDCSTGTTARSGVLNRALMGIAKSEVGKCSAHFFFLCKSLLKYLVISARYVTAGWMPSWRTNQNLSATHFCLCDECNKDLFFFRTPSSRFKVGSRAGISHYKSEAILRQIESGLHPLFLQQQCPFSTRRNS